MVVGVVTPLNIQVILYRFIPMSFMRYYNSSKKHLTSLSVTRLSFCDDNNLFSALFFTFSLDSELEKEIF